MCVAFLCYFHAFVRKAFDFSFRFALQYYKYEYLTFLRLNLEK